MKINSYFDPILMLIEELGINNFEIKIQDNIITYKSTEYKNKCEILFVFLVRSA